MKSNRKKRILAVVLCMVLVLSTGISTMADGEVAVGTTSTPEDTANQEPEAVSVEGENGEEAVKDTGEEELLDVDSDKEVSESEEEVSEEEVSDNTEEMESQQQESDQNLTDIVEEGNLEETEKIEWSQQVGNSVIKVTADKGALPENAELYVNEITNQEEVENIEKAVEDKAIEEQFAVENIIAYDIKFMVGGSEVQPGSSVQVTVNTPDIEAGASAAVLHVDDNNTCLLYTSPSPRDS